MTIVTAYWRKAFRDLWSNKVRAILVLLALVVGVVSVGTVAITYSVLVREMDKNYLNTDPASAILWVDTLDETLVQTVNDLPEIAQAEARSEIVGRFQVAPGEWREMWLYVISDFNDIRVDIVTPEMGNWPPATGEILLERTAVEVAESQIGDTVVVKLPGRDASALSFAGTTHTPGLPPAWVEGRVYGYITLETFALLGGNTSLEQLRIIVSDNPLDEASIRKTVDELKEWLEENGQSVTRIEIPEPGKHPHADLIAAFLSMIGISGLLTLVMSSILVTNMFSAMMAQQKRQIAIMKSMGGSITQIAGIYVTMVLSLSGIALLIGLPISYLFGQAIAYDQATRMLNFEIFDNRVDLWAYGLITMVGLIIPLLASGYPIIVASRKSILESLNDYGVTYSKFGSNSFDNLLAKVGGGIRPILLSLRNVFRRRGRLVLTLITLVVAGANFMAAMNVIASIDREVARKFDDTPYDIAITFSQSYSQEQIEDTIHQVNGVSTVESWGGGLATIVLSDNTVGETVQIAAIPENSELMPDLTLIEGRWLQTGDQNAVVMNATLLESMGVNAGVGDEIILNINGTLTSWELVGISWEFLSSTLYVPLDYFANTMNQAGLVGNVVLSVDNPTLVDEVVSHLETELSQVGFDVYTMWKTDEVREVFEFHMVLVTGILLVMSALLVFVGGLGLASAMSLNVLDRMRELGVLRAIGASGKDVLQIILMEGVFIGILSWIIAILLSIPFSGMITSVFDIVFNIPISLSISISGWGIWFLAVVIIATIASSFPAWSAVRQSIDDVLAYA